MNKNEKFVITINREAGSGGRTVGSKVAEKLGVPFYDKALIQALMEKYHLTVEEIENVKGRKHDWWSEFKRVVGIDTVGDSVINTPDMFNAADIFRREVEILKGIAEPESCVIAGRSGFFVFEDHPNHLSILITAPLEHRIQRLMRKQGITAEEAKKTIEKIDAQRENYINKYTGTSRYDTRNYDLVINMEGKTEDQIANLILMYLE
ncbi:MAG: cytidylate kinase-like family protein [Prevotella sp.]|nr:cytidylate kinase-like family protein [Prevotella sp.]